MRATFMPTSGHVDFSPQAGGLSSLPQSCPNPSRSFKATRIECLMGLALVSSTAPHLSFPWPVFDFQHPRIARFD